VLRNILRGLSLLELMMAMCLFLLLMGAVFHIYSISAKSWIKVRKQVEVKDSAQLTMIRIQRDIRSSAIDSILIIPYPDPNENNNAISFLSSYDTSTGLSDYDENGKMKWTRYILFYLLQDPHVKAPWYYQLCRREVDISKLSDYPTQPINNLGYPPDPNTPPTGTGINPMTSYIAGMVTPLEPYVSKQRIITRNITALEFNSASSTGEVDITVRTGKPVNPSDPLSSASPDKLELKGIIILRNSN